MKFWVGVGCIGLDDGTRMTRMHRQAQQNCKQRGLARIFLCGVCVRGGFKKEFY